MPQTQIDEAAERVKCLKHFGFGYVNNHAEMIVKGWLAAKRAVLSEAKPVGQVLGESQMGIGYDRRMGNIVWFGGTLKGPATLYVGAPPAADAPLPESVREKALNTLLWFYRRMQPSYGRLPFAEEAIAALQTPAAEAKPVAWVLSEEIEKRETTCNAHLWFSDPRNSAWTAIYTAPPAAEAKDSEDAARWRFIQRAVADAASPEAIALNYVYDNSLDPALSEPVQRVKTVDAARASLSGVAAKAASYPTD